MTTRRANMPRLKHALILQADVETLKVQVEALRGVLEELAEGAEVLLRESNPMTAASRNLEKLIRRARGILGTYANEKVRAYFDGLEHDKDLLEFLAAACFRLEREGPGWILITRDSPTVRREGPLREVLTDALKGREDAPW